MSNPIIGIRCLHSVKQERSVVHFYRDDGVLSEYIPTALSVRRLTLWLEQSMFHHSFLIGRRQLEVFITPNRED